MNYAFGMRKPALTGIDGVNSVVGCTIMGAVLNAFQAEAKSSLPGKYQFQNWRPQSGGSGCSPAWRNPHALRQRDRTYGGLEVGSGLPRMRSLDAGDKNSGRPVLRGVAKIFCRPTAYP
jgi:hypothetical protein